VDRDGFSVSGTVGRVPWARHADRIALVLDGHVCVVAREDVEVHPGSNLAGEERDTVVMDRAEAKIRDDLDPDALLLRAALVRVALMAGALDRIGAIAIEYAGERIQFGRPIGRFQAVQAHLVTIAQQAALVGVAADAAVERERAFEIAAAKLLANRAAVTAGRAAHQVLGARGVTLEHPLSLETRRLWSWRSECGDERFWSRRLGAAACAAGADRLYPTITGGSAELET
jgi:acyl-CoA dehydrogenase